MAENIRHTPYFDELDPLRSTEAAEPIMRLTGAVHTLLQDEEWRRGRRREVELDGRTQRLAAWERSVHCVEAAHTEYGIVDGYEHRSGGVLDHVHNPTAQIAGELHLYVTEADLYRRRWHGGRGQSEMTQLSVSLDFPARSFMVSGVDVQKLLADNPKAVRLHRSPVGNITFSYLGGIIKRIETPKGDLLAEVRTDHDYRMLAMSIGVLASYVQIAGKRELAARQRPQQ